MAGAVNEALYSPQWHEVAPLRPALRSVVRVRRLRARGRVWHLLSSPDSRTQLRLNESAWRLVGLLDGGPDLDSLWHRLVERFGDGAPSQPEVLELLAQLNSAGFLKADVLPDLPTQVDEARRRERQQNRAAMSPLSMRVRVFDPSPLLDRLLPGVTALFSRSAWLAWLLVVVLSALYAASEWSVLGEAIAQASGSPRFVLIAWIVYPLMKCVHELAHGLAIRRWGGTVDSAGFTLLVLVPVPYVDARAANAFERRPRMLVSAIGVMTELLIAALAFWIWLAAAPGLVRDVALTAFVIGALSSLLFNGNPLLRFDGYYVLADALDLPNLASRSQRWWHARVGHHLLGARMPLLETAVGEGKWLALYAPASWAFQFIVGYQIMRWIGTMSHVLGLAAGAFLIVTLLILPLSRAIGAWRSADIGRAQSPVQRRLLGATAGAALCIALLPLPSATTVPGIMSLPEQARLSSDSGGFVRAILARDGETVSKGQLIARLEDPRLLTHARDARSRLSGLETQQYGSLLSDPRSAGDLAQQIASAEAELADVDARIAALELRTATDGVLVMPHQDDLPDSFLARGQTLGYVLRHDALAVRAIVPQSEAARVRQATEAVSVRLSSSAGEAYPAHIRQAAAGAGHVLPSPALSDRHGGPIPVLASDADAIRSADAFFEFDIALEHTPSAWIGERAWVRFDHPNEPLAVQWGRDIRQLLLQFFDGAP
jgi:putative peptide zinc metalloprotease protein